MTGSFGFAPVLARARRRRARRRRTARVPRRAPVRHLARARAGASSSRTSRPRSARSRSARASRRAGSVAQLSRRRAPLKAVLLDQRVVAGLGNIYADEALWRARLHPLRPAGELSADGGRPAHARDPRALRAGHRAPGRDAARLRDAGRRVRLDAGRVPRLRPRRGAVSALRRNDREDPRRRSRHVVLPALPAPRGEQRRLRHAVQPRLVRMGRTVKTEAVVLRSFRYGEADRILHLYTLDRGRVGAIAKGIRKTKSRFGARLEPFSHVELMLHQGSGELHTVTGVSLVDAHRSAREDPYRLSVGLVGAEAMLRLFVEQEQNERAFEALTRFLDGCRRPACRLARSCRARSARALLPAEAPLALRLRPAPGELRRVRRGRRAHRLLCREPAARCAERARPMRRVFLSPEGFRGMDALIWSPLADAHELGLGERGAARRARGGRRRRTSSTAASGCARSPHEARSRRRLRAGRRSGADRSGRRPRLPDDESYWASGRARETFRTR